MIDPPDKKRDRKQKGQEMSNQPEDFIRQGRSQTAIDEKNPLHRVSPLGQVYPPPNADEVRIMARLDLVERKLDAILAKLCPSDS